MSDNTSHQDSSVESEDPDLVPPEVLAESIRNKTNAIHAQGDALAEKLECMAEADDDDVTFDPAPMMTELLETASDLIEVAHKIEAARLHDS